ncbi:Uncharacterized protein APZ42_015959 [Daphnia magna]|uniref:Uncharacterized protein n=1 Tax=Daphnia magna TaxID=35525 RepID=A0A162NHB3_9CRUS|nr:Uncharacterized protein APZ42_015959 [Daphnia magna]
MSVVCFSGDSAEFSRHDGCLANWKRPAEFEICDHHESLRCFTTSYTSALISRGVLWWPNQNH